MRRGTRIKHISHSWLGVFIDKYNGMALVLWDMNYPNPNLIEFNRIKEAKVSNKARQEEAMSLR